ncbi:MAG: lamin tail domain-containing protein, partial [Acaryochloridaceae cyanobacterium RU_4_10]|nr:lamin tail domain-containing protein [Acaryochloridaceae cyanobacterium RU_4_10]
MTAGGTVSGVTATAYNSSTGKLTLSGSNTLANYAKIIATLKYRNTRSSPTTSDRRITVQVTDSDGLLSNLAISTLSLTLPPVIDLDGNDSSGVAGNDYTNNFVVGGGAVRAADSDVVVTDDGANLKSTTITLTNRPDSAAESLSIAATVLTNTGVTLTNYDSTTGTLTLSGNATLATYQTIIAELKYNNTATNPNTTTRVINIQVTDTDNLTSNIAVSTLQIQSLSLSGTVFVDLDSNQVQNGTETGYTEGGLYAILVDSNNTVAGAVAVNTSNGSYSFSNISPNQTYTVRLSNVAASIGQTPPAISLPSTWGSTGENLNGTIDSAADSILSVSVTTNNITNANFGLIKYLASPMAGQIVINEVLYNQSGANTIADNDEFIELYNASSASVDLSGWKLIDGNLIANSLDGAGSITGSNSPYVFPAGTILPSKQYAVIWIGNDRTPTPVQGGIAFHTGLGKSHKLNDAAGD